VQALHDSPTTEHRPQALVLPFRKVVWRKRAWRRLRSIAPATWAAGAILALTAFVGLWRLSVPSWHVDEILFAISGKAMVGGDFSRLWQHPPLAMFLYGVGQLLPGEPLIGVRLVAAGFGMATGAVTYVLGCRIAGRRCGLLFAAMWAALPHVTHPLGADVLVPRLDRYGLLDVVAATFMAGALLSGWRWVNEGASRSRWTTGALIGLAAAAKLSGLLALPGIAAFVLWYRGRRGLWELVQSVTLVVGVFATCYLPFGTTAPDALGRMVSFQSEHLARGHSVTVNGVIRQSAPWWAQLDFLWKGDGPLVVVPLVAAAVLALVLIRRAAVAYVAAAVLVPFAVMAQSAVSLPHYRYVWLAPFLLLAALGFDRALAGRGRWRKLRFAAFVLGLPLVVVGVSTTWRIATLERSDYAEAAALVRDAGLDRGRLLVHGHSPVLRGELPSMPRVWATAPGGPPPDVVIVDRLFERRHPNRAVRHIADAAGLEPVRVDRLDVWLRRRPEG
jgi:4-amino-4-deoxy-L-arabinose transferase-like glycosyltransferase